MMRRFSALLLALLLTAAAMQGCAQQAQQNQEGTPAEQGNAAVARPDLAAARPLLELQYTEGEQTSITSNTFAFRLSAALAKADENMVLSPFSVWMTLSALSNATNSGALPALLDALGLEDVSVSELNKAISRLLHAYMESDHTEHNPLALANAVFVDHTAMLQKKFAQTFLDYYRGETFLVDFASNDAVDGINQWASEHTDGLIDEVVQQFPEETLLAIASAIYFSDRWDWEFNPEETEEGVFYGAKGEAQAQFMLREGSMLPYYEDDTLQAMPLAFETGGRMHILLPKDGDANALLQRLDNAMLQRITEGAAPKTGKLLLPRFSLEASYNILDVLEQLGVPLMDTGNPTLTGLVQEAPAYINAAVHKALIEVDEKGTTAAAVTVMAAATGGMMPVETEPFTMICDKPFVFILTRGSYHMEEQILFMGVVNQL